EVARWFAVNGWTYPVTGPTAKGIAAVQQFFEGMGLSKPPPVELSETEVTLRCSRGEMAAGQIVLRTQAKKWVYGRVESDTPWLRVTTLQVSGPQQAVISFEAVTRDLPPRRLHEAALSVVANAGQTLKASVYLEVEGAAKPPRPGLGRPILIGAMAGLV